MRIDDMRILAENLSLDDFVVEPLEYNGKNYVSINNKVPLKVCIISKSLNSETAIEIKDNTQNVLGVLIPKIYNNPIETMSEYEVAALFYDAENYEQALLNQIKCPYVVIEENKLEKYIDDYYDFAPVWGMFSHEDLIYPNQNIKNELIAFGGMNYPTQYHKENFIRLVSLELALDRFLKKYHQFELLFDYDFVMKIKAMNDDLKDFGRHIKTYNNDEMERLKETVHSRMSATIDLTSLKTRMLKIIGYKDTARAIFQEYGKKANPLSDDLFEYIISQTTLEEEALKQNKKNFKSNEDYDNFIINTAMYWIYRIRCCIAHNKIGEYILTIDQEEFMAEFAEPLIDTILIQCISN